MSLSCLARNITRIFAALMALFLAGCGSRAPLDQDALLEHVFENRPELLCLLDEFFETGQSDLRWNLATNEIVASNPVNGLIQRDVVDGPVYESIGSRMRTLAITRIWVQGNLTRMELGLNPFASPSTSILLAASEKRLNDRYAECPHRDHAWPKHGSCASRIDHIFSYIVSW